MSASDAQKSFAQTASKPNILFILTDDMKQRDLSLKYMPNTQRLLVDKGVEFHQSLRNPFARAALERKPARLLENRLPRRAQAHTGRVRLRACHTQPRRVRTTQYSYVEYETGEKELYDLTVDPQELTSIHKSASPALLSNLKNRLDAPKSCTGAGCKVAEDGG